jgi:hypothetical protein
MYKTSKYEYSTSSRGGSFNNNDRDRGNYTEINKLDSLLNDLEHERTATLDRSKYDQNDSFGVPNIHLECNLNLM